jgi:hypothetical protein
MAMCSSGSLSIKTTAGTNRSIDAAVTSCSSGSLSALSVAAGKGAPHCMREFYSYSEGLAIRVDTQWSGPCGGGNGMCGWVYLKCGASVVCSQVVIPWTQGEVSYNWSVPTGTYCIKWCNFCSCGGGSRITDVDWSKNNPSDFGGGTTNVTTSSFNASGCIQGVVTPIF